MLLVKRRGVATSAPSMTVLAGIGEQDCCSMQRNYRGIEQTDPCVSTSSRRNTKGTGDAGGGLVRETNGSVFFVNRRARTSSIKG
jgi:hypothetical protein